MHTALTSVAIKKHMACPLCENPCEDFAAGGWRFDHSWDGLATEIHCDCGWYGAVKNLIPLEAGHLEFPYTTGDNRAILLARDWQEVSEDSTIYAYWSPQGWRDLADGVLLELIIDDLNSWGFSWLQEPAIPATSPTKPSYPLEALWQATQRHLCCPICMDRDYPIQLSNKKIGHYATAAELLNQWVKCPNTCGWSGKMSGMMVEALREDALPPGEPNTVLQVTYWPPSGESEMHYLCHWVDGRWQSYGSCSDISEYATHASNCWTWAWVIPPTELKSDAQPATPTRTEHNVLPGGNTNSPPIQVFWKNNESGTYRWSDTDCQWVTPFARQPVLQQGCVYPDIESWHWCTTGKTPQTKPEQNESPMKMPTPVVGNVASNLIEGAKQVPAQKIFAKVADQACDLAGVPMEYRDGLPGDLATITAIGLVEQVATSAPGMIDKIPGITPAAVLKGCEYAAKGQGHKMGDGLFEKLAPLVQTLGELGGAMLSTDT